MRRMLPDLTVNTRNAAAPGSRVTIVFLAPTSVMSRAIAGNA